ncbi:FabD lysophospholipase-like protein [Coniophora puteana RWD-64-598 SS2]|uniref:FabD lysophospholipase-like protein n=1 Tax=Coniophora puteana (strain RWD-64-598) TaxID=741705 RepID=A0A5M3MQX0_CONPW|nr:FabD lysophospholipase-like protein [Coniophora puteana RWD-64-598 SS2]EIW81559.1 FabD lysophospholipase-like protein [Coniophora puteana RWD-64-598 SS2]
MAEKAQKGRRLLSIDGGGVRGLSALLIIRDIMRRIQIREGLHSLPRPCDYFDLICGSGTGGLIALMLGRLCLPIDDAIASFKTFAKEVYGEGRKRFSKERFKATVLELASRAIVSRVLDDENARLFDDFAAANNACKVFVCAMFADNLNASSPTLLRTYRARNNTSSNFTIWQAARATMAMPGDFKPATLSGEFGLQHRFIDGGVGSNNPSQLALREAESIFPGDALAVLISVGTGRSEIIADSAHQMAAASDPSALMQRVAVDCERVSDELTGRFSQRPGAYYRCSVIHGTEGVSWVDAKALDTVVTQTSRYLEGLRISAELDSMVESLLDVRARAVLAGHNLISSATIRVLKVVPSATPTFTGRHETLSEMDVYFGAGSSLAATYRKVFVLYGPAGVGKSQCAYKFIEVSQAQDDPRFSHVFLIDASSERSIKADLTDLAINGGGVRGLSALLIIREIMYRIQTEKELPSLPRPCDYFDLVGGSGTGGLIALMLGRLRMSVDDAIATFETFVKDVYEHGRKRFGEGKFKATTLELAAKAIVANVLSDANVRMLADTTTNDNACNVFVCAMLADNMNAGIPEVLRTYSVKANASPDYYIWEAVRATMAMPGHFKPAALTAGHVHHHYIDGGVGANNPSQIALREAEALFPGDALATLLRLCKA